MLRNHRWGEGMASQPSGSKAFSAGLYLTRFPVHFLEWPERVYRGVDRGPHVPDPTLPNLPKVWTEWWDGYDSHRLMTAVQDALRLQDLFEGEGIGLEVVYIEVTEAPTVAGPRGAELQGRLEEAFQGFGDINEYWSSRPRPDGLWLGYDIAWPVPAFHSTLYEPGLAKQDLGLPEILNDHGLIAELPAARLVADVSNAMDYGSLPFCVCSVWNVGTG